MIDPLRESLIDALRIDLERSRYRGDSVRLLLGSAADDARARGVIEPARRALLRHQEFQESWQRRCGLLIRLFLLGDKVAASELEESLELLSAAGAEEVGLIEIDDSGECRALVSLNPVRIEHAAFAEFSQDWWVLSDLDDHLRVGPARSDHVMGVGGATRSLIAQAPLGAAEGTSSPARALDLGTGCGIIALAMARAGIERVVATDISARALDFAKANARLNGVTEKHIEFRLGSLFDPVDGETFELVLSNPPFVITPRNSAELPAYDYRDGGLQSDDLARMVVEFGASHLAHGGTLLCLANWEHRWGSDGLQRVESWIEDAAMKSGLLGAWVIERDKLDPARYAEMWVRDGGVRPEDPRFDSLIRDWLEDFDSRRVTAIGLGSIRVCRLSDADAAAPIIRTDLVIEPMSALPAEALQQITRTVSAVSGLTDAALLDLHFTRTATVREVREHTPGHPDPRSIAMHIGEPFVRIIPVDTLLAAAIGACDGDLTLAQISDALAELLEVDSDDCAMALIQGVREMVWLGVLTTANDRI